LLGGIGARRTLPLVARYADIWNAFHITPDEFQARSARLDQMLEEAGRQPRDVKRTLLNPVICGRSDAELERSAAYFRTVIANGKDMTTENLLAALRQELGAITGSPQQVVEQMRAYADAGVEEIMMQYYDVTDFDSVHLVAREVLPYLS
jgi:alkanesulfonate monooxygenase SsuD/methylene tetrahydromethanopterin reductase-like flavin-dependent oxidoreductase (luciferase family)